VDDDMTLTGKEEVLADVARDLTSAFIRCCLPLLEGKGISGEEALLTLAMWCAARLRDAFDVSLEKGCPSRIVVEILGDLVKAVAERIPSAERPMFLDLVAARAKQDS
jgi:hypothetical protein